MQQGLAMCFTAYMLHQNPSCPAGAQLSKAVLRLIWRIEVAENAVHRDGILDGSRHPCIAQTSLCSMGMSALRASVHEDKAFGRR